MNYQLFVLLTILQAVKSLPEEVCEFHHVSINRFRVRTVTKCTARNATGCTQVETEEIVGNDDATSPVPRNHKTCTVFEGSIAVTKNGDTEGNSRQFTKHDYPVFENLREITGFLLINENRHLDSVGRMFPNLRVIGGLSSLHVNGYGLVVTANPDMTDIGLHNLARIRNHGVYITSNVLLCYTSTLNWQRLLSPIGTPEVHMAKNFDNCFDSMCSQNVKSLSTATNSTSKDVCDTHHNAKVDQLACWNEQHCQIKCSDVCGINGCQTDKGPDACCHSECEGGCSSPTASDCYACRHVYLKGKCLPACPRDYYKMFSRRCVTQEECWLIDAADFNNASPTVDEPAYQSNYEFMYNYQDDGAQVNSRSQYVTINGLCQEGCPDGHVLKYQEVDYDINSGEKQIAHAYCEHCGDLCEKVCDTMRMDKNRFIDELNTNNCTIIKDLLLETEMQPTYEQLQHISNKLSSIRTIEEHLHISHIGGIESLDFLESLRVIGKPTAAVADVNANADDYALWIHDLEDLISFFDLRGRNHTITVHGKVKIENNPNICPSMVLSFWMFIDSRGRQLVEVSRTNNQTPKATVELIEDWLVKGQKTPFADIFGAVHNETTLANIRDVEKEVVAINTNNGYFVKHICQAREQFMQVQIQNGNYFSDAEIGFSWRSTNFYGRDFFGHTLHFRKVDHEGAIKSYLHDRRQCPSCWKQHMVKSFVPGDLVMKNCSAGFNIPLQGQPGEGHLGRWSPSELVGTELEHEPYQWYALKIEASFAKSSRPDEIGVSWGLRYYRTAPKAPTAVRNIIAHRTNLTSSLQITWDPLAKSNGPLAYYKITWRRLKRSIGQHIDMCSDNMVAIDKIILSRKTATQTEDAETSTDCMPNMTVLANDDDSIMSQTITDLSLPGAGLVRRSKRSIWESDQEVNETETQFANDSNTTTTEKPKNIDETDSISHLIVPITQRRVTIEHLHQFTDYEIVVLACQNGDVITDDSGEQFQSPDICTKTEDGLDRMKTSTTARTRGLAENDYIVPATINLRTSRVKSNTSLHILQFTPPVAPNGQILFYNVRRQIVGTKQYYDTCYTPHRVYNIAHRHRRDTTDKTVSIPIGKIPPGHHQFAVRAVTTFGRSEWSHSPHVLIVHPPALFTVWQWLALVCVITMLILLLMSTVSYGGWRYWRKTHLHKYVQNFVETNPDYVSQADTYKTDDWEIKREDIELLEEIGHGTFGRVFKGRGKNLKSVFGVEFGECAIKCVAENASAYDRCAFLHEATVMKGFRTPYIVQLLGVVSNGQPAYICMEMMHKGNLRDYLRSRRPGGDDNVDDLPPPSLIEIYKWAGQIADGMAYLDSAKKCHRDLAARNCMINGADTCKIGDFGMARDLYCKDYYRPHGVRLSPLKWMPPESLEDGKFTTKSDVWAYGVVLWEMVTLGHQPYPGIMPHEIKNFVVDQRGNMANTDRFRPCGCPKELLDLMESCWRFQSSERPTFEELIHEYLMPSMDREFMANSFVVNGDVEGQLETQAAMREHSDSLGARFQQPRRLSYQSAADRNSPVHLSNLNVSGSPTNRAIQLPVNRFSQSNRDDDEQDHVCLESSGNIRTQSSSPSTETRLRADTTVSYTDIRPATPDSARLLGHPRTASVICSLRMDTSRRDSVTPSEGHVSRSQTKTQSRKTSRQFIPNDDWQPDEEDEMSTYTMLAPSPSLNKKKDELDNAKATSPSATQSVVFNRGKSKPTDDDTKVSPV